MFIPMNITQQPVRMAVMHKIEAFIYAVVRDNFQIEDIIT